MKPFLIFLLLAGCAPAVRSYKGDTFEMAYAALEVPKKALKTLQSGPPVHTRYCRVVGRQSRTPEEQLPIFDTLIHRALAESKAQALKDVRIVADTDEFGDSTHICFSLQAIPLSAKASSP